MTSSESPEGFAVVDKRGRDRESEDQPQEVEEIRQKKTAPSAQPDLSSLFLMLASSALAHLEEKSDPTAQEPSLDLDQARYMIDLLALLQ